MCTFKAVDRTITLGRWTLVLSRGAYWLGYEFVAGFMKH